MRESGRLGARAAQVIRLVSTEPLAPSLVNTRLSSQPERWSQALRARFEEIDSERAGLMDDGISCCAQRAPSPTAAPAEARVGEST